MSYFHLQAKQSNQMHESYFEDFESSIQVMRSFLYGYSIGNAYSSDTFDSDIAFVRIETFSLVELENEYCYKDFVVDFNNLPKEIQQILNSFFGIALENPETVSHFLLDNFIH